MPRSIRPLLLLIFCFASVLGAQTVAWAYLIAFDDFDYGEVGSDLNNSGPGGSFGFSNLWTGNTSYNISDNRIVPPAPLPISGNSVYGVAYPANRDISRTLSTPLGDDNTTVYVSVLMRPEGILHQGAYDGWFGLALRGSTEVVIGMNYSKNTYGLRINNTHSTSSVGAAVGHSAFLVLRMDYTEGVDPAYLYVNATPGAPEPATPDASLIDLGFITLNSISLTGPGGITFDAIRVGTTYSDVAPATADFNADNVVDTDDLANWQTGYGTPSNAMNGDGDADYDADVDGIDFLHWQQQYGYERPLPSNMSQVPEPATGILIFGTLLCGLVGNERSRLRS